MKNIKSFAFAIAGVRAAVAGQMNLRIHFLAVILVSATGAYFHITAIEWCVIVLASALVIGLEMMNTAIEKLTDLVTPEWNSVAGKVKDIAAGAVLLASVAALIAGVIIFMPYIESCLRATK